MSSMTVAYSLTGSIFGNIPMTRLGELGGVTVADLYRLEFWRLFTAQVIHSKQIHMLYNTLSLVLLGFGLEKRIGWLTFFLVWLIAGAAGTVYSSLFVEAPWNAGTGGSQAILGLVGFSFVLLIKLKASPFFIAVLWFAFAPAMVLDLLFAHYPKPGHVLSLTVGMLIGTQHANRLTMSSP